MNTLERSFAYITRKKTRSMIILLILSVIASSIYACLLVNRASSNLEARILKISNSSFEIIKNSSTDGIKILDIKKIAKKQQIAKINYKHSTEVKLQTGQVVSGNQKIQVDNVDEKFKNILKLQSVADSAKENAFTSESFKLVAGAHLADAKNKSQIMVHEKLAKQNKWKLGDEIQLAALTGQSSQAKFKLVGIFSGKIQEKFNGLSSDLSENTVYTNFSAGRRLVAPKEKPMADQATFFLEQPEKINQVIAGVKKYPLNWQNFEILKNTKAFEKIISSIKTMQGIIGIMTFGIIVAGIVALSLILVLWLRERVYEIGVFLALGQQKIQIIGQFILELALITLFAMLITVALGNILSNQLLTSLLAGDELNELSGSLSLNPFAVENLLTLGICSLIMLMIIASAVLITSFSILSQKPKKILSKIS